MDTMRRLHFGANKHAEFTAHVHILDLLQVPLIEGECRLKWKFKDGINLNHSNNDKVMGYALQNSKSYLKDLKSSPSTMMTASPSSRGASAGVGNHDSEDSNKYDTHGEHEQQQHHSLGERVKDAIFHPHRTLKASTSSSHSQNNLAAISAQPGATTTTTTSPRSRSHTLPHSPSTPTSPYGNKTDYFKQSSAVASGLASGNNVNNDDGTGGNRSTSRRRPSASDSNNSPTNRRSFSPPPSSPHSPRSPIYQSNPLSPALTLRAQQEGGGSGSAPRTPPPAAGTGTGNDRTTPPSRSGTRQSEGLHYRNQNDASGSGSGTGTGSNNNRRRGSLPPNPSGTGNNNNDSPLSNSLSRAHTTLYESLKIAGMPSKAESKGKTSYTPLVGSTVRFDQHIICAVAIPMKKNTRQLEESVIKLKVLYKVRSTPLPERIGSRPASMATTTSSSRGSNGIDSSVNVNTNATAGGGSSNTETTANANFDAKSIASSIRSHKTRVNGSNVSLLSPSTNGSGSSTPMINSKEAHEEVHLGDLWLDLSEFVSAELAESLAIDNNNGQGQGGLGGNGSGVKPKAKESWITRRYLLQNGRTNALLRVAVKMDWLSGIRDFTAPGLSTGQIISPKKHRSRHFNKGDKEKDQDRDSSYSNSVASGNSSRLYLQGDNASSRSFISADYSMTGGGSGRPPSSYRAVSGKGIHYRVGDSPDGSSDDGHGGHRHLYGGSHEHDHHHHYDDESTDDLQAEVDLINEIFETEDTPPNTPPQRGGMSWGDDQSGSGGAFGSPFEMMSHSHSTSSLINDHQSHHHNHNGKAHNIASPAQKFAFLHRNKEKLNKGGKNGPANLGVADLIEGSRKRTHSAPSRAVSSPAGSVSRPSTPASDWYVHEGVGVGVGRPGHGRASHEQTRPSHDTYHSHSSHGSGNSHNNHHYGHEHGHGHGHSKHDEVRPVLVHVPTSQEAMDIHMHPFRWIGKPTPAMRAAAAARQSSTSSTSSMHSLTMLDGTSSSPHNAATTSSSSSALAAGPERAKTLGIGELSKPRHASGLHHSTIPPSSAASLPAEEEGDDLSRTATTSKRATSVSAVAAQVFKMPFRNRSTSNLSTTSTTSTTRNSIIEHTMPVSVSESNLAAHSNTRNSSEDAPSRGSLDLQRTLRPGQTDPTLPKSNLKRTTSPAPMTVSEEREFQEYVQKSARTSFEDEQESNGLTNNAAKATRPTTTQTPTDESPANSSGHSSPTKTTKEVRWEENDNSSRSIREIMRRVDEQHQRRLRERRELEEDGQISTSHPGSSRSSSRASSLSNHNNNTSRNSSLERRKNRMRQPSNDDEVNERARVLREKGLLPTLSITNTEDMTDPVSPIAENGPSAEEELQSSIASAIFGVGRMQT